MPSQPFKQRSARVFLSSTFRDFGEERDLLVKKVFPVLRARLEGRCVELVDVDLRWGITEADAEKGEVLPICLAEIDNARPFFIGLLGERYGWIPPRETYPLTILEQHPWLEEHRGGKSVTELEILHGVLNNPVMAGRAMFYFRSPDYSKSQGGDYIALSAQDKTKQDALKDCVRASEFPVVENYATPEDVAQKIQEDLWSALEIEFPASEIPDAFTRDLLQHETYAAPRRRIYLGGEAYLEALDQALRDNIQWIHVMGDSGSGKSALLANWIEVLTDEEVITHVHYVGANPSAADPVAMVRRIIEWIQRETGAEDEPASDSQKLLDSLPEWLSRASAWASLNNKRFLLVLDALSGISDRRDLRWFPRFLPAHVQCVVSTLPGEVKDNLMNKAPWHVIEVNPLDVETARQVFVTYLGVYNKTLPDPLIDQVMTHPLVTNPLFLITLAEELRLFGEHEQLSQQLKHYQESITVDDLFERVLARIEADHGLDIIYQIMTALWASRSGLREEELLIYTGLPLMKWSYIRHALGPALIESNGRYVFAHDYLRIAVSDRYMAGNNSLEDEGQTEQALQLRQEAHIRLALWFADHAFQDDEMVGDARAAEEIPYQWLKAQDWEQLASTLTQLNLFQAISEHREQQELLAYWLIIEATTEITLDQAYERAWSTWNLDQRERRSGDVANQVANLLRHAGRVSDFTVSMAQLALNIVERSLEPSRQQASVRLGKLAALLKERGEYAAAEPLFRNALAITQENLGLAHPDTATAVNNLAIILYDRGDLNAAELLFREALEITESALGPDHIMTGARSGNLAAVLYQQGSLDAAEPLFRKAVEVAERTLGANHPDTGDKINNLALLLQDKGDLSSAGFLLRRALEITEKALGPKHPSTATRINNLALLLQAQGELDAAEALLRSALKITEDALGLNHPATWTRVNNLMIHLYKSGDFDAAEPLFRRAIKLTEELHGPQSPNLAQELQSFGVFLRTMGRHDEALLQLSRALHLHRSLYGQASEQVASCLTALGTLYKIQCDIDLARESYLEALKIIQALPGTLNPKLPNLYKLFGELEFNVENKEAAKELFKIAFVGYTDIYGEEHPLTQAARSAFESC